MKFKRQIFGFMDMLRFKKLVPNRRKMLASGSITPLKKTYRVNEQAKRLHPGYMQVKLVEIRKISQTMTELTFNRVDSNAFPYFRAGQYVTIQAHIAGSIVSRPYSIVSTPKDALSNKLVLGIEEQGFMSKYLCHEAKIGDAFMMLEPAGEFHYETLRDKKNIVCIAGGSGITPFMSMLNAKAQGTENYDVTLFYGARDVKHLAYKDELDKLAQNGIKVIYVLSDEENSNMEHGFIGIDLIKKYVNINDSTFFLCGPKAMYDYIIPALKEAGLANKYIHKDASCCTDLNIENPRSFNIVVHMQDETYNVKAMENETILVALERAKLNVPSKCRAGGCGFCHAKLVSGEFLIAKDRDGRREADKKFGFIHPCVTYPLSDMEIIVNEAY